MGRHVKLGPKVLIFIGVSLIVILGISFALMLRQREREALERTSHLMENVGRTVATSMQAAMREGDMESIQDLIVEVATGDFESIRIVDGGKKISQSGREDEIGGEVSDPFIDTVFDSMLPQTRRETEEGKLVLRQVLPLVKTEACIGCHDDVGVGEMLGVIDLKLDIEDLRHDIQSATNRMIWWGVIIVIVVGVSLFFLLQYLVLGPIVELSHGATEVAAGNTSVRVSVRSGDEIGMLAAAFNKMTVNLNDALEKSSSIVRGISDPMLTIDLQGTVTFMNDAAVELTETMREDAVGTLSCKDLLGCSECGEDGCSMLNLVRGDVDHRDLPRRVPAAEGGRGTCREDILVGVRNPRHRRSHVHHGQREEDHVHQRCRCGTGGIRSGRGYRSTL
jgi:HAMP domain-containing protein